MLLFNIKPVEKAEVAIDSSNNDAILIFTDTGIGIAQNDTENIFLEFVRIRNEKTRNISGSGLGLSVVKKSMNIIMGLQILIALYEGTVCKIKLPKKLINIT